MIERPRRNEDRPDRDRLAIRFEQFKFKQETVALECSALRQRTCHSTIWRTAEESAYVERFQGIQADGFAGEQFIRVSGTIS